MGGGVVEDSCNSLSSSRASSPLKSTHATNREHRKTTSTNIISTFIQKKDKEHDTLKRNCDEESNAVEMRRTRVNSEEEKNTEEYTQVVKKRGPGRPIVGYVGYIVLQAFHEKK